MLVGLFETVASFPLHQSLKEVRDEIRSWRPRGGLPVCRRCRLATGRRPVLLRRLWLAVLPSPAFRVLAPALLGSALLARLVRPHPLKIARTAPPAYSWRRLAVCPKGS